MKVSVDIHNEDLGQTREVTDIAEQIAVLCKAIAHADQTEGAAVRALLRLAYELSDHDALDGAGTLVGAAAFACNSMRVHPDEAAEILTDNMKLCAEIELEQPRTS